MVIYQHERLLTSMFKKNSSKEIHGKYLLAEMTFIKNGFKVINKTPHSNTL